MNAAALHKFIKDRTDIPVFQKAAGVLLVNMLGILVNFLLQMWIARKFGITQFGQYSYTITIIYFLLTISILGMDTVSLRFLPVYDTDNKQSLISGFLRFSFWSVIVTSTILGTTMVLVVWYIRSGIEKDLLNCIFASAILLPMLSLFQLYVARLRAFNRPVVSQMYEKILRPVGVGVLAGIFVVILGFRAVAPVVIFSEIVSTLLVLVVLALYFDSRVIKTVSGSSREYQAAFWSSAGTQFLMISLLQLLLARVDILMIGWMLDTTQAGIYRIANNTANFVLFGLIAVNSVVAPRFADLYASGKREKLQRVVTTATGFTLLISIPVTLCIISLGSWILSLFGHGFGVGYPVLVLLSLGHLINVLCGSVGFLMAMTGHQREAIQVLGVAAGLNILLNLALVPEYGIIGSSVAKLITVSLWNIALVIVIRKKVYIDPSVFMVFRYLIKKQLKET